MLVRPAVKEDLAQILDIYNDVIVNTTAVYDYRPHTYEMRLQWFESRQQQGFPVFVADDNSIIKGFSSMGPFRAWAAYKYSVENSVYVKLGEHGKGIGKQLLRPIIDAAVAMDLHTIIAGIDATNAASIKLHEQFGFKKTAVLEQAGYKFGKWLDLLFMQLILQTPAHPSEI
jgi:L-amino acid N-acyltransferase